MKKNSIFADGEHSLCWARPWQQWFIGRTLLGMEVTPEGCYADAKSLEGCGLIPE